MADIRRKGLQETIKITLNATLAKDDFILLENYYVVLVEGGVNGNTRAGYIRGTFDITKASASEVINKGEYVEYVDKNQVQKFASGTIVGRAVEDSANGDTTVCVELEPTLNNT